MIASRSLDDCKPLHLGGSYPPTTKRKTIELKINGVLQLLAEPCGRELVHLHRAGIWQDKFG